MPGRYQLRVNAVVNGVPVDFVYPEPVEVHYGQTSEVDLLLYGSHWVPECALPGGDHEKKVKAGACLAVLNVGGKPRIYALRGNRTFDFLTYDCDPVFPGWSGAEPIPGAPGARYLKGVAAGGALARCDAKLFALKGGNTSEFWAYDPETTVSVHWRELASVPAGKKRVGDGAGLAAAELRDTMCLFLLKGSRTSEFYRYNPASDKWTLVASAPTGSSGRGFAAGSALCSDSVGTVFALKARTNEFFAYRVAQDTWVSLPGLPLVNRLNRKKKVGPGGALTFLDGCVYALKGNSSLECWRYDTASMSWQQMDDVGGSDLDPARRVGPGGALTGIGNLIYALKGNNSLEMWSLDLTDTSPGPAAVSETRPEPVNYAALDPELEVQPSMVRSQALIRYSLPAPTQVRLDIVDITGRLVRTLPGGSQSPGVHLVTWNRCDQSGRVVVPGVYFLRLQSPNLIRTRKIVVAE
jgi:hypothetical protein